MKILNTEEYISEKLDIKPISKDDKRFSSDEPEVDEKTRATIKNNHLVWNKKTRRYDCDGNVSLTEHDIKDGKFTIQFGVVKGWFDCSLCKLISLEGAPIEVGGTFYCDNNNLTSLVGAPQETNDFNCSHNYLTNLKGAPKTVIGDFNCEHNNITSLEGAPEFVGGNFYCKDNYNRFGDRLVMPKDKPSWIGGEMIGEVTFN
jgi:hypothetical protein